MVGCVLWSIYVALALWAVWMLRHEREDWHVLLIAVLLWPLVAVFTLIPILFEAIAVGVAHLERRWRERRWRER